MTDHPHGHHGHSHDGHDDDDHASPAGPAPEQAHGSHGGPPGHEHDHGAAGPGGIRGFVAGVFSPHGHDAAESIDTALTASAEGIRALKISGVADLPAPNPWLPTFPARNIFRVGVAEDQLLAWPGRTLSPCLLRADGGIPVT